MSRGKTPKNKGDLLIDYTVNLCYNDYIVRERKQEQQTMTPRQIHQEINIIERAYELWFHQQDIAWIVGDWTLYNKTVRILATLETKWYGYTTILDGIYS
jgi:precorrin-3B methylase